MLKLGVLILKWPKSQILHIPYPYFMRLKCFLGWVLSFTTIQQFATWPVFELLSEMDANLSLVVLIKCVLIKKSVLSAVIPVLHYSTMTPSGTRMNRLGLTSVVSAVSQFINDIFSVLKTILYKWNFLLRIFNWLASFLWR